MDGPDPNFGQNPSWGAKHHGPVRVTGGITFSILDVVYHRQEIAHKANLGKLTLHTGEKWMMHSKKATRTLPWWIPSTGGVLAPVLELPGTVSGSFGLFSSLFWAQAGAGPWRPVQVKNAQIRAIGVPKPSQVAGA